jgi:uncharacterized Tic20 family protein
VRAAAGHLAAAAAVLLAIVIAGGVGTPFPPALSGMVAFAGPAVVLATAGRRDPFVRRHALAALRFNLSIALYLAAIVAGVRLATGTPYLSQLVPFLLFCNLILALNWLVFTAIGAVRAYEGQLFTYPMTLTLPRRGR